MMHVVRHAQVAGRGSACDLPGVTDIGCSLCFVSKCVRKVVGSE